MQEGSTSLFEASPCVASGRQIGSILPMERCIWTCRFATPYCSVSSARYTVSYKPGVRVSQCHGNPLCSARASRNVLSQSQCCPVTSSTRCFHPALPALAEGNIEVPSMGDSITEGSVASVEKKAGAWVFLASFCVALDLLFVLLCSIQWWATLVLWHSLQVHTVIKLLSAASFCCTNVLLRPLL